MGRPLWLHISALSPDEYDIFPSALEDIASVGQDGDKDWESRSVSVLVAKGWMRGRYRDQVDGDVVDKILRYFYPSLGQTDVLSAGQFFAALRLISHAQRGHALDRNLVFIQARPFNESAGRASPHKAKSLHNLRPLPPPIQPAPVRPFRLARDDSSSASDGQLATSTQPASPVQGDYPVPKSAPPVPASSNPFRRTLSTPGDTTPNQTSSAPPLPKFTPALVAAALASSSAIVDDDGSPVRDVAPTSLARSLSTKTLPESPSNPFRRGSHSPAPPPIRSQSPPILPRRPPLPPRETNVPMLPPPRHPQQPAKPPKPSVSSKPKASLMPSAGGTPSELIKQSLRAAKGAQRANETSLEKQRTWEVIKSSTPQGSNSNNANNSSGVGLAQAAPQLTTSNLRSLGPNSGVPPAGPSSSTSSSLDRVAAARPDPLPPVPPKPASHQGHSRAASASRPIDIPATQRPTRSKSLHHSPNQTPPLDPSPIPPPPRRRPESMQFGAGSGQKPRTTSPSPSSASRRTSLARSHALYDQVRRRAGELEPKLDAVRAKAESKIAHRGYMSRRRQGEQGEPLVDSDDQGEVDWREWDREDSQARRYGQSPTRGLDVDRDTPTPDHSASGWRPLAG